MSPRCLAFVACLAATSLPAQSRAPRYDAIVARTIAPAELGLRAINGGAVLGDGTFVTADPETLHLIFVSPDGKVTRGGGEGDTPGRFRQIRSVGATGMRAWAVDGLARRVTAMSAGGFPEVVRSAPRELLHDGHPVPLAAAPLPVALLADGAFLAQIRLGERGVPPWAAGHAPGDVAVVAMGAKGEMGAVVAWAPVERCTQPANVGTSGVVFPIPFCPRPLTVVAPDGSRVAVIEAVRGRPGVTHLRVTGSAGDSLLVQTVTDRALPVTRAAVDSVRADLLGRMPTTPGLAEAFAQIPAAPYRPAVRRAFFAREGTLWLETAHDAPGSRWLAIDTTGAPSRLVTLPAGVTLLAADGDALWAVTGRDRPFGLVRYALRRER